MSTVTFDTHYIVKKLISAGFTEKQAEAVTDVTKDVKNSIIDKQYLDLKIKEIDFKIKELESKLTIRIYIALGAMTTFLCIALPILIKRL